MKGDVIFQDDIGVKIANLKKRTIEECLNCKKYKCNGCPIAEYDGEEVRK